MRNGVKRTQRKKERKRITVTQLKATAQQVRDGRRLSSSLAVALSPCGNSRSQSRLQMGGELSKAEGFEILGAVFALELIDEGGKGVAAVFTIAESFSLPRFPRPHNKCESARCWRAWCLSLCVLFLPLLQPELQRSKSSEINEPEIAIVKNSAGLRSALRKFYPLDGTSLLTLAA